ncbi:TIGR04282 family arsenosugar biosynthesis glycosyltransferase [Glycocaulis sp.]|uniref:TIGR04282 family arsenosugar biosynthesis glycosyltransferase n=1 Tax=Glycocaulis sp. TaxID=1969725 RepID=UPI003F6E44C0
MRQARLIVFARAPVIGGAKTRLAAGIGKVMAWRAYRAMTAKTLRAVRDRARWQTVLAVSPDSAIARAFGKVWPDDLARWPQGGGDLGARQARVLAGAGGWLSSPPRPLRGHSPGERGEKRGRALPIAIIGTDAPDITRRDVARGFALLKRHDAVIGPAEDGGYWLLALKSPPPPGLFDGIRWSSVHTRRDLEARLRAHGLARIAHLRELADVDEV